MVVTNNISPSQNISNKKSYKPVLKGTVIAGVSGGVFQYIKGVILNCTKLRKDEFIKTRVKGMFPEVQLAHYKQYLEKIEKSLKPQTIGKTAGIFAAVGAGIGLIVSLVKNSKANSQQQDK